MLWKYYYQYIFTVSRITVWKQNTDIKAQESQVRAYQKNHRAILIQKLMLLEQGRILI